VKRNVRLLFFLLTIGIAALAGFRMYSLTQEEELWGHWPLLLFLFSWLSIAIRLLPREGGPVQQVKWRNWGLASLSGILLAGGFPPLPFPFLLFGGFVPLLFIADSREEGAEGFRLFPYFLHAFILWNILSTFWVANANLAAGIFANTANALLMCIPVVLGVQAKRLLPKTGYQPLVVFWLAFEYLHYHWDLSWPWLHLGNGLASFPGWIQWYEYTGVLGGSLWILAMNLVIYDLIKLWADKAEGKRWVWPVLQWLFVFFVPLLFSVWTKGKFTADPGESSPVEVVAVQPNYEPHYEKPDTDQSLMVGSIIELAERELSPQTEYLVLPESTLRFIKDDQVGSEPLTKRLRNLCRTYPKLKIIAGMDILDLLSPDEASGPNTRTSKTRNGQSIRYESWNAAVQIDSSSTVQFYKKSKLVPGAEFFPFQKVLGFLKPFLSRMGGSTAGVVTQEKRSVLKAGNNLSVASVICYESVYGEFHTGYIREGAQISMIITNDGWWDKTAGHKQHLAYASLRAIETRRPITRAANTGISAFIDAKGYIHQATEYEEPAVIRRALYPNAKLTLYIQWGDVLGRISSFAAAILLLNLFVKGILKRSNEKQSGA
jgi:apolipoprotein N-acyltransferase